MVLAEEGFESTGGLLSGDMGFAAVRDEGNRYRFAAGGERGGSWVDVLCMPDGPRGRVACGTVHHVAFRVSDDVAQETWRRTLAELGFNVSPVLDRQYFHSIYFREPGGILFELATDPPGFTVDESPETLGAALKLPPQLESLRAGIEQALPRLG